MNAIRRQTARIALTYFDPADLDALRLRPEQAALSGWMGRENPMASLARLGSGAWSAWRIRDSVLLGVGAIVPLWPGRAAAVALVGDRIDRRDWPEITRTVRRVLDAAHANGHRRLEASVAVDFPAAARWADALGFTRETAAPMRAYGPDGSDHYLYARLAKAGVA